MYIVYTFERIMEKVVREQGIGLHVEYRGWVKGALGASNAAGAGSRDGIMNHEPVNVWRLCMLVVC